MKKWLFPLFISFLLFANNCWASFPTTSILDTATRANENPLSDGGKWSTLSDFTSNPLQIASNTFQGTSGNSGSYWNVSTFTDSEVYVTVSTVLQTSGDEMDLPLRYQVGSLNGYYIQYKKGSPDQIIIQKLTGGSSTGLATYNQNISSGDAFGGSAIGNSICAEYEHSGSWSQLGCITDSTYTTGSIAMFQFYSSSTGAYTNFGGGAYVPPVVTSPTQVNIAEVNHAQIN